LNFLADNQSVAWEAHVGGFLAGLLLFALFDPVRQQVPPPEPRPTLH
jgi:membrane associated rhomboid family serine protease